MFGFKEIDANELTAMQADGKVRLVDVRTDAEVARGMIQGAAHIPLHMLPLRASELDPATPVVFYCQSGARSAQACAFMVSKGFNEVYNLQGGIMGWIRAGRAIAA